MEWKTWQGNIETLYKYFLAVAQPILLYGPMKRGDIIDYCVENYSELPKDINFGEDILTKYETTCRNTYMPAMFKLGLLREDGNLITLTPAAKQLINAEVSPLRYFRRQVSEYQFKNPYSDMPNSNLFPYWILLRFLRDLSTINKDEALFIILKMDHYDDQMYQSTLDDIYELRSIKSSTTPANLDSALTSRFGPKNSLNKAWQYERNYLKWTGFCKDGANSSIELIPDDLEELDALLITYPTYKTFNSKQEYSDFVGRSFDIKTNIYLFNEDINLDPQVNVTGNKLILETTRPESIKKNDTILFARTENAFSVTEIWLVQNIKIFQDRKMITCIKTKSFNRPITKEEITSIIQ